MTDQAKAPHVLIASSEIQKFFAATGVAKDSFNREQKWNFRSIDAIMSAVSAQCAKHSLIFKPSKIADLRSEQRVSKSGSVSQLATVIAVYEVISAIDGTRETIEVVGSMMDSGDKASAKAMSMAFKYAAIQYFCIPVVGMPDGDFDSPDYGERYEAPAPSKPAEPEPVKEERRATFDDLVMAIIAAAKRCGKTKKEVEDATAKTAKVASIGEISEQRLASAIAWVNRLGNKPNFKAE